MYINYELHIARWIFNAVFGDIAICVVINITLYVFFLIEINRCPTLYYIDILTSCIFQMEKCHVHMQQWFCYNKKSIFAVQY